MHAEYPLERIVGHAAVLFQPLLMGPPRACGWRATGRRRGPTVRAARGRVAVQLCLHMDAIIVFRLMPRACKCDAKGAAIALMPVSASAQCELNGLRSGFVDDIPATNSPVWCETSRGVAASPRRT
jgi:hypothetical protein